MLRGDNVICGTSTTGTGTLTLAATPTPPGGVDFDVFARATGVGFGNSDAILVSYTIIEYTSSTFATAKATEKGIGTLTLGSSSGVANATLVRTTKQTSATSLNSQPAAQNISPATGISIGTAANTLVFIGASAADLFAGTPYANATDGDALGVGPLSANFATISNALAATSGTDLYVPFTWFTPMLVKRCTVRMGATAYTGGTPVSNAYGRLYAFGTNGRPGKLLYNFGAMGSAGTALNSATVNISSGASGNGFFLTPGQYWFDWLPVYSGGVTPPTMAGGPYTVSPSNAGTSSLVAMNRALATSGNATAPDPANLTGYSISAGGNTLLFTLASV